MQLTTHGSLYGLLLDDGVELVGDGSGMTLTECEMWAEAIEQHNPARSWAKPVAGRFPIRRRGFETRTQDEVGAILGCMTHHG